MSLRLIFTSLSLSLSLVTSSPLPPPEFIQTQPVVIVVPIWTPDTLSTLASTTAITAGLNPEHFVKTLYKESKGFIDPAIQSKYPDPKGPGGHENSWGICQIDLDFHPELTKEQAIDPVFCTKWTAEQWQVGHATSWSAYRQLQVQGWPTIPASK